MHSVADHPVIGQRYFFPRTSELPGADMVAVDGAQLGCFSVDKGHELTLLHFHGNGEIVADYLPGMAELFDSMGLNSFFAEYRGYGASTGEPQMGKMLDDVAALCERAGDPSKLVVFGRSVGSIYAVEAAHRFPEIAGLVLESGIADPLERVLLRASPRELGVSSEELVAEFSARFDHKKKLAAFSKPALVLHAAGDDLVDKSHAERNAEWIGSSAELAILPRGDHNSIFAANQATYIQKLRDFVSRL